MEYSKHFHRSKKEYGVTMAYITARLCLFDLRFKGDQFPKSPQEVLGWFKSEESDPKKPMTVEQWRVVAKVLDDAFGDKPLKTKR